MLWAVLLGLLAGVPGPSGAGPDPAPGVLLYASPYLGDPNFGQTVVLLVAYDEERGAEGIVVNSPTGIEARKAVPDIDGIERFREPIYYGGPVQPDSVHGLVRRLRDVRGAVRVVEDVYFTGRRESMAEPLSRARPERWLRLFVGYAGWGPGQLDAEIAHGDWLLEKADPSLLFSDHPEELWRRVYQLRERIEARAEPPSPLLALDRFPGGGTK